MTLVKFNAPAHHTLEVDDRVIHGGATVELSDEIAEEMLTNPYTACSEVDPVEFAAEREADLSKRTRTELEDLAEQAGVENPSGLPNKPAVIAAIEEAEADLGDEPTSGEGDDNQN
ncbi:MAG: Rho termination factor N-terminal domain-containing protein [Gaiellaceae bacterium]